LLRPPLPSYPAKFVETMYGKPGWNQKMVLLVFIVKSVEEELEVDSRGNLRIGDLNRTQTQKFEGTSKI